MHLVLTQPDSQRLATILQQQGITTVLLPLVTIQANPAPQLIECLTCDYVVCTSPSVVNFLPADLATNNDWFAVGPGSALALQQRYPHLEVTAPQSHFGAEGVIELLEKVTDLGSAAVGEVTGVGGRGVLQQWLQPKVARYIRADVYKRVYQMPEDWTQWTTKDCYWLFSSGNTLGWFYQQSANADVAIVVTSERLVRIAQGYGYTTIHMAKSNQPEDIVALMQALL